MTAKLTMRAFWFFGFAAIRYASVAAEPSDTDSPRGGPPSSAKTKVQPRTQTVADDRFPRQVPSGAHRQVVRNRRNLWVNGLQIRRANLKVVFNRGKASGLVNRWLDDSLVDLKRILQSFGIEFSEKANKESFSIVVGGPVPRALAAAVEKQQYPQQVSVIQITDNAIRITSPGGRGLPKAIYTFLDRLGVRWYSPGKWGECLPEGQVKLASGSRVEGPDFLFRNFYWSGTGTAAEPPDVRRDYELWQLRMRMDSEFGFGGHSYTEQIAPLKKYAASHPEYYSLISGKRAVSAVDGKVQFEHQLCVSNKQVQQLAIDFARRHFQRNDTHLFVSISPDDGGGFCQCEGCAKIGGPSDQTVFLANVVARAIRKEYPDRLVGFYAYSHHLKVPEKRGLVPNVVPFIVNSYTSLGFDKSKYYDAVVRETPLRQVIEDWAALAKRTAIRFNGQGGRYPYDRGLGLQDDFRLFRENKAIGVMVESSNSFIHQGWVNYWASRLAWDVDRGIKAEQAEFYQQFYGPAAPVAKQVLHSIQNRQELSIVLLQSNRQRLMMTIDQLSGQPYRSRLGHLQHYLEYLLAREQYLRGKGSVTAIDPTLRQIHKDRSYALGTKPGAYTNVVIGRFKRIGQGTVDTWRDGKIIYRARHMFAIKIQEGETDIRLHLWNGSVADNRVPIELTLLSSAGRILSRNQIPCDTTAHLTLPVPKAGTYLLRVHMKASNQFRLEVENPLFVVRADKGRAFSPYMTRSPALTRYFYVPNGTTDFKLTVNPHGPVEWVTFRVITPAGKIALSKDKWVVRETFKIIVPPAIRGNIWQLRFQNPQDVNFSFSDHIPGWLASHPDRLIVPERFLDRK